MLDIQWKNRNLTKPARLALSGLLIHFGHFGRCLLENLQSFPTKKKIPSGTLYGGFLPFISGAALLFNQKKVSHWLKMCLRLNTGCHITFLFQTVFRCNNTNMFLFTDTTDGKSRQHSIRSLAVYASMYSM